MGSEERLSYTHFAIETLADGVYAVITRGSHGANAAIVDLGDRTLIMDTTLTIRAAQELRDAAEALTGRPATYVINSHVHSDHILGNVVFADQAVLIASTTTRADIADRGVDNIKRWRNQITSQRDAIEQQLAEAVDTAARTELESELQAYDRFLDGMAQPEDLRVPTLAYDHSLAFHGSKRTAHMITFGGAHSPCDATLWLPAEQILFIADLVIPSDLVLYHGTPENWMGILDQAEALGARLLVPGHGGVTPAAEGYAWARQYLSHLFRLTDEAVAAGETAEYADRMVVPDGYVVPVFRNNMRFLIARRLELQAP